MWVFTKKGMVSIVRFNGGGRRGTLLVRARAREHLVAFAKGQRIHETPDADYPFRMMMSARDVAEALELHAMAIDYGNFKAAAATAAPARDAFRYQDALSKIWLTLVQAYRDIRPLSAAPRNGHYPGHVEDHEAPEPPGRAG